MHGLQAIRNVLLPFDTLLSALAKVGAIDSNPLQDWQMSLSGLGHVSSEDLDKLLEKLTATTRTFDGANPTFCERLSNSSQSQ